MIWKKFRSNICVINYEALQRNIIQEITKCVAFLGFQIDEKLQNCIVQNQTGFHKRSSRSYGEIGLILSFIDGSDYQLYQNIVNEIYKFQ